MEEELRAILHNASGVTALVPAARINLGEHPQGAGSPYVHIIRPSGQEGMTLKSSDGLMMGRIQVDCYAPTAGQSVLVSRAVEAALSAYRGGGFRMISAPDTQGPMREGGTNEAERLFRVRMDFNFAWRAT